MEKIKKERKKLTKKQIITIIVSIVISLLAMGGIITAFILNYNVSTPDKVSVYDDGKNVYVKAEMNDNYSFYNFKFTQEGQDDIIIETENNVLTLEFLESEGIVVGQEYQISVKYISENDGNDTDYSEPITWMVYKIIQAPILSYEEGFLKWEAVEFADYYKVFYNGTIQNEITTTETSLDLQTIEGGKFEFVVVAYSNNNDVYKKSIESNKVSQEVIHKYLAFESVEFDSRTKIMKIKGYEKLDIINVYLDSLLYECNNFKTTFNEEEKIYEYEIDLSLFYSSQTEIGASPAIKDEYNVYDGEITYVQTNQGQE